MFCVAGFLLCLCSCSLQKESSDKVQDLEFTVVDNKELPEELLKEIDSIYANCENVVFYPAFITGSQYPMEENEKVEYIKQMLLTVKNIKKLTVGTKLYSLPRMHACMNGDPRFLSILLLFH